MKFSNVRLLVKDFAKCFKFYSEQLGLEPAWGDENSGYAYFKVADGAIQSDTKRANPSIPSATLK